MFLSTEMNTNSKHEDKSVHNIHNKNLQIFISINEKKKSSLLFILKTKEKKK